MYVMNNILLRVLQHTNILFNRLIDKESFLKYDFLKKKKKPCQLSIVL